MGGMEQKKVFSMWKVLLPTLIGIIAVILLFIHDASKENMWDVLKSIRFNDRTYLCIIFVFIAFAMREFGLTWRFRILTDNDLSWRAAFGVDMLCEFTSCVTPSAVGGSALGMIFLNSKGIEFGRATTLMLVTIFLDELFFVIFCPVISILTDGGTLFASGDPAFSKGIQLTFWGVYAFLALYTLLLFCGIIWKPLWIQKMLYKIFQWRFLRRWAAKADNLGANMVATSALLRSHSYKFWIKAFAATSISWIGRFLVVNALFFGFMTASDPFQWLIFAREFVIWVILMVSPTPGGSGLSEWIFSSYYGDLVNTAGMALILAVLWRLATYYVYLFSGIFYVPSWLKNTISRLNTPN